MLPSVNGGASIHFIYRASALKKLLKGRWVWGGGVEREAQNGAGSLVVKRWEKVKPERQNEMDNI